MKKTLVILTNASGKKYNFPTYKSAAEFLHEKIGTPTATLRERFSLRFPRIDKYDVEYLKW